MNIMPNKLSRQATAIALLALLGLTAWVAVVQPIIALSSVRISEIADLNEQIASLRATAAHAPTLQEQRTGAIVAINARQAVWSGPDRSQIAVTMQDVLRAATQQGGGHVVSASMLGDDAGDIAGRLSVRARVDGTLGTLQHVLTTIDQNRPRLFVDSLVVTTTDAGDAREHAPTLSFELSVSGFLDDTLNAHKP